MRPVCVQPYCGCEMRPEQNGVGLLYHANDHPYKLYLADLWECPKCHHQIIYGRGIEPIAEHYQENFKEQVNRFKKPGERLFECY